jgi:hypothetical protein
MKYLVNKKKFARLLRERPALARTIVTPTENFALSCFHLEKDERAWGAKFEELYIELPKELKTLAVTRKFIKTARALTVSNIPLDILLKLSKQDRLQILEHSHRNIEDLPNSTYEEWLYVISNGYRNHENIPADMWTEELALEVAKQGAVNYNGHFESKFPDHLWNQDFAIKVVTAHVDTLDVVPTHLINNEVLRICLGRDLGDIKIPKSAWDQSTAENAMELHPSNIQYIPKQYITEKINIIAATKGIFYKLLTIKTYPVLVAYVANNTNGSSEREEVAKAVHKIKDKETFIQDVLKVVDDDRSTCLFNLGLEISEDLWLKIIKASPELIKRINRCDQTPAMVDAFLGTATSEVIDKCAESINLGKIKAQHAPFLIGCENVLIQEIRNKFLKAGEVHTETIETIEVDMAPSEYAKIKGILTSKT